MIPLIDVHTHQFIPLDSGIRIHQLKIDQSPFKDPFSVSIHPWDVEGNYDFEKLKSLAEHENCLAVGETGLDKIKGNYVIQIDVFRKHIQLAKNLQKPLIIHCVKAFEDCIRIIAEEKFTHGVLFHGFNKHPQLAQQLIKKGFFLSLGAHFLKENPNFDRFFIENEFQQVIFETDNASEIAIETLYKKAETLCPILNIREIIYNNFKDWKTR